MGLSSGLVGSLAGSSGVVQWVYEVPLDPVELSSGLLWTFRFLGIV